MLLPVSHTVVVTDSRGCQLPLYLYIPAASGPIIQETGSVAEACNQANGQAEVIVTGGSQPLTYEWDGNPALNLATLSNASAGVHTVLITDDRGCTASTTVTIDHVEGPKRNHWNSRTRSLWAKQCFYFFASDWGHGNLSFYNWSTFVGTNPGPYAENLAAGVYTITLTDARGCTDIIPVTVPEIAPPTFGPTTEVDEACGQDDGAITFELIGGTPPFSYEWSHDPNLNSLSASGLSTGAYFITVTDHLGCTATNWATLSNFPPPAIEVVQNQSAHCDLPDGVVSVLATSFHDNPTFTYTWSHDGNAAGPTQNNLLPGYYEITVTDHRGCSNTTYATVGNEAGVELFEETTTHSSCDLANGFASVIASGGTLPYSYAWSFDNSFNSPIATNLVPEIIQ